MNFVQNFITYTECVKKAQKQIVDATPLTTFFL